MIQFYGQSYNIVLTCILLFHCIPPQAVQFYCMSCHIVECYAMLGFPYFTLLYCELYHVVLFCISHFGLMTWPDVVRRCIMYFTLS